VTEEQLRQAVSIFSELPDERKPRGLNHSLVNIVTIALCAVMSGADTYPEIQAFGETKKAWLKGFLNLRRIPDHDTFRRVFARLNPVHFQSSALDWIRQAVGTGWQAGDIVSIDGKRLRGTSADEVQGIHMVNVWAARQGLCLSATAVEGKCNEISTLPSVLDTLSLFELAGCVVTIDAMGTQREVAKKLVSLNAQYLLALKGNQGSLFEDVQELFEMALNPCEPDDTLSQIETLEQQRGREERRTCWMLPAAPFLDEHAWPGLQSVVMVRSQRTIKGVTSQEDRYFLSTLPVDASRALQGIRTHWHIENRLHWVLDVAFREDQSKTRTDHGPENLATLRRWALNLMRLEGTAGGIAQNRKRVGWDDAYRSRLVALLAPT
jgi:predicted transposase YbfD/YdcC